jgi:hypothetical protein
MRRYPLLTNSAGQFIAAAHLPFVPAKAGTQCATNLDSRFRGNERINDPPHFCAAAINSRRNGPSIVIAKL